ncbi:MAG: hypothetical protein C4542_07255 [Dehalococcoidia bacterium]|nr:MAG: hypothetical protein C4542_07255 [Dehalococcoidia bacterium]
MIQRELLKNDFELHTIWQEVEDGVGEPALNLRDYSDGMVEIKQGKNEILVSHGTLSELIKVLKHYQRKGK